uniref:Lipoprotein n=1 Tax=Ascaris lumbricoides TaxID=6252 RepID=A0A0M3IFN6_ASCLU
MMINGKSIVVFLATITLSQCIFKIKDLQRMVSSADDRLELKLLNKQDNIPRNEIKKKVDAIVQKQPSDVQDTYNALLQAKEAKDEAEYNVDVIDLKQQGASNEVLMALEKIHNITLDMSLSRSEEEKQIKAVKNSLKKKDRKILDKLEQN